MRIRKKIAGAALAAVMTLGAAVPVFAHDGWAQTNTPIVAQGQVSYVELMYGNHSNEHKSYRIEGQWSTDTSKVYVTTPAGVKADITSTRFYTGEPSTETTPAKNNYLVASFKSNVAGAYIVSTEGDSVFKGETSSRTLRSAKTFVAVGDIPVLDRVKALTGFSRQVSPDRAELVPLFNPAAITTGEQVSIQLLLKGKPLADTAVDVIRRSNSEATELTTDANGIVKLAAGAADYYLVRSKPSTTEAKEGEYDVTNYEATMTFTVQNKAAALPTAPVAAKPIIYVNGQTAAATGLAIVNGVTKVDASFIREHVNADFKGTGLIALRQAVAEAGAAIEFFPAAAGVGAAVAIYTK
jgi:uncharacterized GH25 family protein